MPAAHVCLESRNRMIWEECDPISFLRAHIAKFQPVRVPGLPPLVAGAIGYFSYDMVRLIERLPKRLRDDIGLYDAMLMFYRGLIAFDHVQHRLWIVRNVYTEGAGSLRGKYNAAVKGIRQTRELLQTPVDGEKPRTAANSPGQTVKLKSNFARKEYLQAVRKAKQYIRAGDIFQAVISQRFSGKTKAAPFDVYRELRALNPSPYLFLPANERRACCGQFAGNARQSARQRCVVPADCGHALARQGRSRRSRAWNRRCWQAKKNGRSTSCWWTWEEMTWDVSANTAA